MKISQVEWGTVAKAALKEYPEKRDDVPGLAAEMAYWIVFSLFPLFAFLAFVAGIVGRFVGVEATLEQITGTVLRPLGGDVAEQVSGQLRTLLANGGALSVGAILSAILALNSASSALTTTMKAFNRAYGVEETRGFVKQKLVALGLTLVLVVLLVGGAVFLSLGGQLIEWLGLGTVGTILFQIVRFVAPVIGISLGLAILYWKGPNVEQQFQWISPGSILATLTLVIFSLVFGLYVQFIGNNSYTKTYGAVAGIILFLLFLRWASAIVLLGAEFNAEAAKRYDPETIRDKVTDPNKMLPGQQPAPHPQALREAGVSRRQVAASDSHSARKLANGNLPTAAAQNAHTTATADGAAAPVYAAEEFDDPTVEERLRAIRERPFVSARAQASAAQSGLPAGERTERARKTVTAFAVSAATAVGGVLFGTFRRGANH